VRRSTIPRCSTPINIQLIFNGKIKTLNTTNRANIVNAAKRKGEGIIHGCA
jgi:hypothetical protein